MSRTKRKNGNKNNRGMTREVLTRRPYRVVIEIRHKRGGLYSLTLVSRGTRPVALGVNKLRNMGYDDYAVYVDRFGYVRVHYTGLSESDIQTIRTTIYNNMIPSKKSSEEALIPI